MQHLVAEGDPPAQRELAVVRRRDASRSRHVLWRHDVFDCVDALPHVRACRNGGLRRPQLRELLDLGHRADDAGQLLAGNGFGQRRQRFRRGWPGEDELVRRGLQRGADGFAAVADEPEPDVLVETVPGVAADAEDEVVPCLVGEKQRLGFLEKGCRVAEPRDLHYSSSSTSTVPPATRSPSPT